MEAAKSRDLQYANKRPRKARVGVATSESWSASSRDSHWNRRPSETRAQGSRAQAEAETETELSLGPYLPYLFLCLGPQVGCCPPTLEMAVCFTHSSSSHAHLFLKYPHRYAQRYCSIRYVGTLCPSQVNTYSGPSALL